MVKEVWKDVVGFEGIYEVSNLGRIKSPEGKITYSKRHGQRKWKERIIKQTIGKDQSCRVKLYKDNKQSTHLVHRLVAYAFMPLEEGKEFINHIDGSRLNNKLSNLEWCDHTENNNHAFDNDLIQTANRVVLENTDTGEMHRFRSMVKASEFLDRNQAFISTLTNKGIYEYENYNIYVMNRSTHNEQR